MRSFKKFDFILHAHKYDAYARESSQFYCGKNIHPSPKLIEFLNCYHVGVICMVKEDGHFAGQIHLGKPLA